MKQTIFIQIASYRDPELVKTLDDLIDKASKPDNLTICVAHQHHPDDTWDSLDKYKDDKRFKILDIPSEESKGACWARNKIQQEYNGETYTFQLDSHHRFEQDWDKTLIQMLKSLQKKGHKKPLITTYIPSYEPSNDPEGRVNTPWGMRFDRFTPEGVIFFLPYYMEKKDKPIPARFYSAHFAFTIGDFAKEVQHDPSFYFHGEEITIAVRAYTHGYDLFHPNKVIAWHEYTREGRTKQWDDDPTWGDKNTHTHSMTRKLLGVDGEICSPCNEKHFGIYGLGSERTLEDYELYSGIRFKDRGITKACRDNFNPPGFAFQEYLTEFKHPITLYKNQFPEPSYDFVAVIFEDKDNKEIYRQDIPKDLMDRYLKEPEETFTVWRKYNGSKPNHIIIWPFITGGTWGTKITLPL